MQVRHRRFQGMQLLGFTADSLQVVPACSVGTWLPQAALHTLQEMRAVGAVVLCSLIRSPQL